jgi:alpha-amylase
MATPSEIIAKHEPVGEIDVPELGGTVSWADLERDVSCWLGNTMQWAYYTNVRRLEPFVKETEDEDFIKMWRYFQTSDHLYYMFTAGGAPGEVHSYFSPYNTPTDAFVTEEAALIDFENRVRLAIVTADEPFLFYTGLGESNYTGIMTWSLEGFARALQKISIKSLEFHDGRGDFEKWAKKAFQDKLLIEKLKKIRLSRMKGERLRKSIVKAVKERFEALSKEIQATTKYF